MLYYHIGGLNKYVAHSQGQDTDKNKTYDDVCFCQMPQSKPNSSSNRRSSSPSPVKISSRVTKRSVLQFATRLIDATQRPLFFILRHNTWSDIFPPHPRPSLVPSAGPTSSFSWRSNPPSADDFFIIKKSMDIGWQRLERLILFFLCRSGFSFSVGNLRKQVPCVTWVFTRLTIGEEEGIVVKWLLYCRWSVTPSLSTGSCSSCRWRNGPSRQTSRQRWSRRWRTCQIILRLAIPVSAATR